MGEPLGSRFLLTLSILVVQLIFLLLFLFFSGSNTSVGMNKHNALAKELAVKNNSDMNMGKITSQEAESMVNSFVSPKALMASAIDQIRNNTGMKSVSLNNDSSILADSATILLSHEEIMQNDFIHLYDLPLYKKTNAHITARLPCNINSISQLNIVITNASKLHLLVFTLSRIFLNLVMCVCTTQTLLSVFRMIILRRLMMTATLRIATILQALQPRRCI